MKMLFVIRRSDPEFRFSRLTPEELLTTGWGSLTCLLMVAPFLVLWGIEEAGIPAVDVASSSVLTLAK